MPKRPTLTLVHGFAPPEDVEAMALAKLAFSGLDRHDAKRLGITWHPADEVAAMDTTYYHVPALRFAYVDPFTKRPMTVAPGWPDFHRVRFLRQPPNVADKDFAKYKQPKGVCAYFPSIVDWSPILTDHTKTLIITEGELKAAKTSKESCPTIGLGGVDNYRARKLGHDFLPELKKIVWPRRTVFVIYDSDIQANSNVVRALNDLADELSDRGAIVKTLILPSTGGAKTGLDDFLVENHVDRLTDMLDGPEAIPVGFSSVLWKLNERYVYVRKADRIFTRGTGDQVVDRAFKTAEQARYHKPVLLPGGRPSTEKVNAATAWLDWPLRQDAHRLVYRPGEDPFELVPSEAPRASPYDSDFNLWSGWGVAPKRGDPGPFLRLIDHLFTGAEPGAKEWFLRWCAYPLQHPGTKLFTSAVVYGLGQGTGKTLIGYTLKRIYGQNFSKITQNDFHGNFNEWATNKQFVMGDDVTGSDKLTERDYLKMMITQEEITINAKYQTPYTIKDCINYYWTSNQPDAFFLEDNDRRFFIHEVTVGRLPEVFFKDYDRRLKSNDDFAAAVFQHLLDLDLTGFNPNAAALHTRAKADMTRDGKTDLYCWASDLARHPDDFLVIGDAPMTGDLFTLRELASAFSSRFSLEQVASYKMAKALKHAGVRKVHGGANIRTKNGVDTYYAVRHADRWLSAPLEAILAHLAGDDAPRGARPPGGVPRAKKY